MTRNVKPSLEKKVDIEQITSKLLNTSGLKIEEFLFKNTISMDAYRKMVERGKFSRKAVRNILAVIDVNEGFLRGTEALTSSGKLTLVQNRSDNKGNPLGEDDPGEVYRTLVEGRTKYLLVHQSVLEKHEKQLDKKDDQIKELHEIIKGFASGGPIPTPKIEHT